MVKKVCHIGSMNWHEQVEAYVEKRRLEGWSIEWLPMNGCHVTNGFWHGKVWYTRNFGNSRFDVLMNEKIKDASFNRLKLISVESTFEAALDKLLETIEEWS